MLNMGALPSSSLSSHYVGRVQYYDASLHVGRGWDEYQFLVTKHFERTFFSAKSYTKNQQGWYITT